MSKDTAETVRCSVVVGDNPAERLWPYVHCGKVPAKPVPGTEGTDWDFPMCAEHREMFKPAPVSGGDASDRSRVDSTPNSGNRTHERGAE